MTYNACFFRNCLVAAGINMDTNIGYAENPADIIAGKHADMAIKGPDGYYYPADIFLKWGDRDDGTRSYQDFRPQLWYSFTIGKESHFHYSVLVKDQVFYTDIPAQPEEKGDVHDWIAGLVRSHFVAAVHMAEQIRTESWSGRADSGAPRTSEYLIWCKATQDGILYLKDTESAVVDPQAEGYENDHWLDYSKVLHTMMTPDVTGYNETGVEESHGELTYDGSDLPTSTYAWGGYLIYAPVAILLEARGIPSKAALPLLDVFYKGYVPPQLQGFLHEQSDRVHARNIWDLTPAANVVRANAGLHWGAKILSGASVPVSFSSFLDAEQPQGEELPRRGRNHNGAGGNMDDDEPPKLAKDKPLEAAPYVPPRQRQAAQSALARAFGTVDLPKKSKAEPTPQINPPTRLLTETLYYGIGANPGGHVSEYREFSDLMKSQLGVLLSDTSNLLAVLKQSLTEKTLRCVGEGEYPMAIVKPDTAARFALRFGVFALKDKSLIELSAADAARVLVSAIKDSTSYCGVSATAIVVDAVLKRTYGCWSSKEEAINGFKDTRAYEAVAGLVAKAAQAAPNTAGGLRLAFSVNQYGPTGWTAATADGQGSVHTPDAKAMKAADKAIADPTWVWSTDTA